MRRLVLLEPTRLLREGLARLLTEFGYQIVYQASTFDPESPPSTDASVDVVLTELPDKAHRVANWIDRLLAVYPGARIVILTTHTDDPEQLASAFEYGAAGYLEKDSCFEAMHAALDAVMHGQVVYPYSLREGLARKASRSLPDEITDRTSTRNGHGHAAPVPVVSSAVVIDPDRAVHAEQPLPAARPVDAEPAEAPSTQRETVQVAAVSRHAALPPHGAGIPHQPDTSNGSLTAGWLRHKGLSDREAEILRYVAVGDANKVIANHLDISEATVKSHIKSVLRKLDFQNRTQAAVWAHSHAAQLLSIHAGKGAE